MIKLLNLNDRDTVQQLLNIQIPAYKVEAELIGFDGIPQLSDTIESIQASGETFLGFIRDNELQGCISYTETEEELDICRLVVHPKHFRKGIAKQLLICLLDQTMPGKRIIVSTGSKNSPALELYKLFEFREVDKVEIAVDVFITILKRTK